MAKHRFYYCNGCGKQVQSRHGILQEELVRIELEWGYFSKKDGEIHSFCLCEDCYDRLREQLLLPVEVRQREEYL